MKQPLTYIDIIASLIVHPASARAVLHLFLQLAEASATEGVNDVTAQIEWDTARSFFEDVLPGDEDGVFSVAFPATTTDGAPSIMAYPVFIAALASRLDVQRAFAYNRRAIPDASQWWSSSRELVEAISNGDPVTRAVQTCSEVFRRVQRPSRSRGTSPHATPKCSSPNRDPAAAALTRLDSQLGVFDSSTAFRGWATRHVELLRRGCGIAATASKSAGWETREDDDPDDDAPAVLSSRGTAQKRSAEQRYGGLASVALHNFLHIKISRMLDALAMAAEEAGVADCNAPQPAECRAVTPVRTPPKRAATSMSDAPAPSPRAAELAIVQVSNALPAKPRRRQPKKQQASAPLQKRVRPEVEMRATATPEPRMVTAPLRPRDAAVALKGAQPSHHQREQVATPSEAHPVAPVLRASRPVVGTWMQRNSVVPRDSSNVSTLPVITTPMIGDHGVSLALPFRRALKTPTRILAQRATSTRSQL